MSHAAPAKAPLPDASDRLAAQLAELALAGRLAEASALLEELRVQERERREVGEPPTGLVDESTDLIAAVRGEPYYRIHAEHMLASGETGPVLERRLEVYLQSQPLERATARLSEHRRMRIAQVTNSITEPLSRFVSGATLNPVQSGRSALAALLVMYSLPAISTQERQALRAYQDFLDRDPDAPEAAWVAARVAKFQRRLHDQLEDEAIEYAELSLDKKFPHVAIAHLDRAGRIVPPDAHAEELRAQAVEMRAGKLERLRRTYDWTQPLEPTSASLLVDSLIAPPVALSAQAAGPAGDALGDERAFLGALGPRSLGDEDAYFAALETVARGDPAKSNMARHAHHLLVDRDQNPFAAYRAAQRADGQVRRRWVLLGSRARGPLRRDLWRPLEWVIDIPGIAISVLTMPLRAAQYPGMRPRFGGVVIDAGQRYVARLPHGQHAEEVHRELESLYTQRRLWTLALEHHEARADPNPETVARYRERIAERTLAAARAHPRPDVRASIYRRLVLDFGDTPPGQEALREFQEVVVHATPQNIRISREFFEEQPQLWQPDALGLKPELFDEDDQNGELAPEGVTLIGQTAVRIALVDREPVEQRVPSENFAHFVALLEEASYEQLVTDVRERPAPDPQRDLFFERARLGLLDTADSRPSAASHAVFLGSTEKYGLARRPESILPVELVLSGGLEDFGLSAFPRLKFPATTEDAFLYQ